MIFQHIEDFIFNIQIIKITTKDNVKNNIEKTYHTNKIKIKMLGCEYSLKKFLVCL